MSRVFIVSEPLRWDPEKGQWVRSMNLGAARRFGEMVYLLPPNNEAPSDPNVVLGILRDKLSTFGELDYLLPVGKPLYIAWASAIAAARADGILNFLDWQHDIRSYAVVRANILTGRGTIAGDKYERDDAARERA
jgi:hypothetical protein